MFEQLSGAQERYQAINDRLMDPNVVSDPKQYAELMKEYKNLTPIVEKYCEYKKATEDMEEAKMMLEEGGLDKDFRELIEEQYETSKKDIEVISEQLKILLIPKDPNDDKTLSWKFAAVQAATRLHCLQTACTVCTRCMQKARDGRSRCSTPTRPSWAATRKSAFQSTATALTPNSSLNRAYTVYSVYRRPKPRVVSTPLPLP